MDRSGDRWDHVRGMRRHAKAWIAVGIVVAALMAAALVAGCSGHGNRPAGGPSIRGLISTEPGAQSGHLDPSQRSFMVIGTKHPDTQYISAQVTVNSKTKVWRLVGRTLKASEPRALQRGQRVEVWFEGPVAESEPVQATAGAVVILAQ